MTKCHWPRSWTYNRSPPARDPYPPCGPRWQLPRTYRAEYSAARSSPCRPIRRCTACFQLRTAQRDRPGDGKSSIFGRERAGCEQQGDAGRCRAMPSSTPFRMFGVFIGFLLSRVMREVMLRAAWVQPRSTPREHLRFSRKVQNPASPLNERSSGRKATCSLLGDCVHA